MLLIVVCSHTHKFGQTYPPVPKVHHLVGGAANCIRGNRFPRRVSFRFEVSTKTKQHIYCKILARAKRENPCTPCNKCDGGVRRDKEEETIYGNPHTESTDALARQNIRRSDCCYAFIWNFE